MDATTLLERLKTDAAVDALATLTVDALLETPVRDWLPAPVFVKHAHAALESWLATESSTAVLSQVVEGLVNTLSTERRALKDLAPAEVKLALKELVRRPFSPDRKLVLTIIDRGPTRELVRQILLTAVLDFGRKASAPVAGVAKGLGALARFAGDTVKSRGGTLGSLVGAVGNEVERQLEKRAVEFVDAALAGVFGQLADALSDPRRAAEAAELRAALFDGVLELTPTQLSRELVNLDVPGGAEVLRAGLTRWLAQAHSDAQLATMYERVSALLPPQTTRELLGSLGLLEVARAALVEQTSRRMRQVVGTAQFEAWLTNLFAS